MDPLSVGREPCGAAPASPLPGPQPNYNYRGSEDRELMGRRAGNEPWGWLINASISPVGVAGERTWC